MVDGIFSSGSHDMKAASPKTARRSVGSQRSEASADAIRTAAEELLIEKGYAGFSIEAVAKRARAGKPTIYRWWPSKAALLIEVYQRQKRFTDPDTGNVEEDLVAFLASLFRLWRDTPAGSIFRSVIAEAQSNEDAGKALAAYSADRRAHCAIMIERGKARGEVDENINSEAAADLVGSYAWVHLLTNRLDEEEPRLRAAVACIVHGLKPKGR